jgi:hypothetical protein
MPSNRNTETSDERTTLNCKSRMKFSWGLVWAQSWLRDKPDARQALRVENRLSSMLSSSLDASC